MKLNIEIVHRAPSQGLIFHITVMRDWEEKILENSEASTSIILNSLHKSVESLIWSSIKFCRFSSHVSYGGSVNAIIYCLKEKGRKFVQKLRTGHQLLLFSQCFFNEGLLNINCARIN